MNPDLCKKLVADHPALFALAADPRERVADMPAECRNGWHDLLDALCRDLEMLIRDGAPQVQFWLIKQKFGRLKISARGTNPETKARITRAENDSLTVCEFCGQPGVLTDSCGIVVVCPEHRSPESRVIDPAEIFRDIFPASMRSKYPAILVSCEFTAPYGWHAIVKTMLAELENATKNNGMPPVSITAIKEVETEQPNRSVVKSFAKTRLDIQFVGGDDFAAGVIAMAIVAADYLCCLCGAPSLRVAPDGWPVLCCREYTRYHAGHEVQGIDEAARCESLLKRYPMLLPRPFGVVGFGWLHLIEALADGLQARADATGEPPAAITYIKEKFGEMSIFHGGDDYANGMVEFVENLSGLVCDVCGKPGKTNTTGWRATRCERHRTS